VTTWEDVVANMGSYAECWSEVRPTEPRPRPIAVVFVYVDEDAGRARAMAEEHMGNYWRSAMEHYGMTQAGRFAKLTGNEHWKAVNERVASDLDTFVKGQVEMMVFGTPAQVIEQLADLRQLVDMCHVVCHFTFATLPYEDAESSMKLFASEVLPEPHSWQVDSLVPL
jgi:alkanesulfonate monooxygenase SsuD/methylene tetrahydromethanopterin reductase-like flavin-dependent oxidoreductase (luciferase family)